MKNILVVGILISSLGMVFFFPLNINEKYTCFFHRIFDHMHPVSSEGNLVHRHVHQLNSDVRKKSNSTKGDINTRYSSEKDMMSASHGSPLLDTYLGQYAFAWWASVGLFALSVLRWLKLIKKSKKNTTGMIV